MAKHFDDELVCPKCEIATFKTKDGVTAQKRLTGHLIGNTHLLQGEELQRIIGIALKNANDKWQTKQKKKIKISKTELVVIQNHEATDTVEVEHWKGYYDKPNKKIITDLVNLWVPYSAKVTTQIIQIIPKNTITKTAPLGMMYAKEAKAFKWRISGAKPVITVIYNPETVEIQDRRKNKI